MMLSSDLQAEQIQVVTENFAPFQFTNEAGKLTGYSIEVAEALFERTGDHAKFKVLPWARAYQQALSTPNTLLMTVAHSKIRDPLFQWVGAVATERLYFWGYKSEFPDPFSELEDLKQYSVAATIDANPYQFLLKNNFPRIYQVSGQDSVIKMLFNKRADFIVFSEQGLKTRTQKYQYDFALIHPVFEVEELNSDLSFAFSIHSDQNLVRKYQDAFQSLIQDGVLESLKRKWAVH